MIYNLNRRWVALFETDADFEELVNRAAKTGSFDPDNPPNKSGPYKVMAEIEKPSDWESEDSLFIAVVGGPDGNINSVMVTFVPIDDEMVAAISAALNAAKIVKT